MMFTDRLGRHRVPASGFHFTHVAVGRKLTRKVNGHKREVR